MKQMKTALDAPKLILIFCLYLSLIRATNIGLFLPSDELELGNIDYSITKYMNYLILLGVLGYLFLENNYKPVIEKLLSPSVTLFIIICLISIVFSIDRVQSFKFMIVVTAISLPVILYAHKFSYDELLTHISYFSLALCFICLIYILIMPQYGIMSGKHAGAWRGLFAHKNIFGPFFAIVFYFFLDRFYSEQLLLRMLFLLAMLISIIFVIMCKSSTAVIGFVLMGAVYAVLQVLYRMPNLWERIAIILAAITIITSIFVLGSDMLAEIILQTTGKDMSLSGRTNIWIPLIEMSYERPVFGWGLGMAQRSEFMERIHGAVNFEVQSSHNSYLDLIIGIGYPGTLIFMIFILKASLNALCYEPENRKEINRYALIFSQMIMMLIIASTSSYVLLGRSIFWLFMLLSILMLHEHKYHKKSL